MKTLLILSGKGGTGKTTVASAFIAYSNATAIADCDVDAPNLHLAVRETREPLKRDFLGGMKAKVQRMTCIACGECVKHCRFGAIEIKRDTANINEISCEGCGVCQLVCPTHSIRLSEDVAGELSLYNGERIFSSAELKMGRGNSGKLVSEVKYALFAAAKDEPLAIIDGSPGIGCPVIASIGGADLVLAVAEPSVSGISDLKRLYKTATAMRASFAVCVNKFDVNEQLSDEIEAFCKEKNIDFVGRIPFDRAVPRIINNSLSIKDIECPAEIALREIYEKTMLLLNGQ